MTTTAKRCDAYNCADDHLLHLSGDWPHQWLLTLVGGPRPYLNIEDADGKIVASLDKGPLKKLAEAILEAVR